MPDFIEKRKGWQYQTLYKRGRNSNVSKIESGRDGNLLNFIEKMKGWQ